MDVELKHHYGWERHSTHADSMDAAAMQAVRETHHFLTEGNHSMEAGTKQIEWGGETISFNSVRVYRGDGAPAFSGPRWSETPYWFAVEYRSPTKDTTP